MEASAPSAAPQRVSLSEVIRAQFAMLTRTSSDRSSVTITRGARGQVQLEVAVHVGSPGADTPAAAAALAQTIYDSLDSKYPAETATGGAS